ncbi:MAG: aldose 1-epimerase family protein [Victivallales bacterium]|nr:aldose 1-epimerase family protein [Victivallales bacterium]
MNLSAFPPPYERQFLASMEQLADLRLTTLEEGAGRGMRLLTFDNGSGLSFTVTPDRGMDIVECRFNGIPLAFRTPAGYCHPAYFDPNGNGWLRAWQGGLLTTSGLRNSGVPNGEFGLHGRASAHPAEDLALNRGLDENGVYRLSVAGTMREATMFGENLRLHRTIATAYQDNSITLTDTFTNLSPREDFLQLLYHCNFGWPFASPELEFVMPDHPVRPRTDKAKRNLDHWNRLEEPSVDYEEECFFHELPTNSDGMRQFKLFNRKLGIGVEFSYDPTELPELVEWKNCLAGSYALGIEPGNVSLNGRTADIADGKARKLKPYESVKIQLKIEATSKNWKLG